MHLRIFSLLVLCWTTAAFAAEPAEKPSQCRCVVGQAALDEKLVELKRLQSEIYRLRKQLGGQQQLLVKVRMLEASPKRFEEAGQKFDLAALQQEKRLDEWCQSGLVRIIAEPQLITVVGRPASCHVGGRLPAAHSADAAQTEFGTRVDIVGNWAEDGTIRLECRAHHSVLDFNHAATLEGQLVPGLAIEDVDTAANVDPGKTLVIGSFVDYRSAAERAGEPSSKKERHLSEPTTFVILVSVFLVDAIEPEDASAARLNSAVYPQIN